MSESDSNAIRKAIVRSAGSLVVALIVQSFALGWWASQISTRMVHVERGLFDVTQRVHAMEVNK